jgi:hypothetical protein
LNSSILMRKQYDSIKINTNIMNDVRIISWVFIIKGEINKTLNIIWAMDVVQLKITIYYDAVKMNFLMWHSCEFHMFHSGAYRCTKYFRNNFMTVEDNWTTEYIHMYWLLWLFLGYTYLWLNLIKIYMKIMISFIDYKEIRKSEIFWICRMNDSHSSYSVVFCTSYGSYDSYDWWICSLLLLLCVSKIHCPTYLWS